MKIAGANTLPLPVTAAWDALLDPGVLVRTIPGCERLETTGEHAYAMTVTAGVASIKGTYTGSCTLSDLRPHESLVMRLQGAGAPGTVDATVDVRFEDLGDGSEGGTRVTWEADAVVGGMVGGVGQRMLSSVSRRMAGEFFDNVGRAVTAPAEAASEAAAGDGAPVGAAAPAATGQVFRAPAGGSLLGSRDDFVRGIAVGAGLVLLGVVAGGFLGRRRE
jgi:carbon monoxide dehydrogenase subunit G